MLAHFHYIYIEGKEGAKMTCDHMKMLMLTLPFMICDLIAPEVHHALFYAEFSGPQLLKYMWYILHSWMFCQTAMCAA